MASYDDRPDKKAGNPGDDYRRLLFASKKKQISVQTIPGVRGMLVMKDEADAFLARSRKPIAKDTVLASEKTDVLLTKANELLERIAVALESMK